jgi:hypothetical protein
VRDYIAQFMFNSPPGLSDSMDLAKMLAILDLIEPLAINDPEFHIWRQTRTGLLSYPLDVDAARAHLATSVYVQMALKPHIVHVVGYTEADHAATAPDVIESCKLARRAVENALAGQPDLCADPVIQRRREELVREAQLTLEAIAALAPSGVRDPFTDPGVLASAVTRGILDAPQLRNNPYGRGEVRTRMIKGACLAVDDNGNPLSEEKRIEQVLSLRQS